MYWSGEGESAQVLALSRNFQKCVNETGMWHTKVVNDAMFAGVSRSWVYTMRTNSKIILKYSD